MRKCLYILMIIITFTCLEANSEELLTNSNANFTKQTNTEILSNNVFIIDEMHTYKNMDRSYAQGYTPLVEGDIAYVVLPLLSDVFQGDITAEFSPINLDTVPIKITSATRATVSRKNYKFSDGQVSAYRVFFKLSLFSSRHQGEYPCKITVHGQNSDGHAFTQIFPITLRITNGVANVETPNIGIEGFIINEPFYVGSSSTLRMKITNYSITREARAITLTMKDDTGDILPKASNSLFIGTLAAGESKDVEILVDAVAKATAQPHALEFMFSFNYADGKTGTKSEKHTVNLQQEVRLNHSEATLPVQVVQGENIAFNLTLMNMGKGTLNNILLTFDVPYIAAGGSVLVGTIEPGKSASSTANLHISNEYVDETKGTLKITWEDGYGKNYEKVLPLSTVIGKKATLPNINTPNDDVKSSLKATPGLRELISWILSCMLLILLFIKSNLDKRKIRKLEEKQL